MKHLVLLSLLTCLLLADTVPNLGTQNPPEGTVQRVAVESNYYPELSDIIMLRCADAVTGKPVPQRVKVESNEELERLADNAWLQLPSDFAPAITIRTDSVWVEAVASDHLGPYGEGLWYLEHPDAYCWSFTTHYYLDFDNLVLHLTAPGKPKDTLTVRAE